MMAEPQENKEAAASSEVNEKVESSKEDTASQSVPGSKTRLAVVLVRGLVGVTTSVRDTLKMLKLSRKNQCVVVNNDAVHIGMIKKVKDYVTWGEITDEVFKDLISKRGVEYKARTSDRKNKYQYKTFESDGKKFKPYFSLSPPRKGFGRKGIKMPFKVGGALGYRGEKMNDLLQRML